MTLFAKLRKLKILLIDDDEWIRDSMRVLLASEACRLVACETAEEALDTLDRQAFDIIIADYKLPGMNGIRFFENIRSSHPAAIKILISAYLDRSVAAAALGAGVHEMVEKPFNAETFETALSRQLANQEPDSVRS